MSYKVYTVTNTTQSHKGYIVKINGEEVDLNTARVSAFPFNRRWPGKQRSLDQSELVNFLSLETNEALEFEIIPTEPFKMVEIRPKELGIVPEITHDGRILFTLPHAAYFTVEPYSRHNALHIFADPCSNYSADKDDENIIYFGKGEHDVGMIELQTGQTVFIDEGAVVYGCIKATDCENISIVGRGILDNSKNKEIILFEANEENNVVAVNNAKRTHTIQLEYCKNIKIEGITIRDSLVYNIRPMACENLDIQNVKIIGCWRYNSDGIDMHNCVNVNINNCFVRTFDDCICIKGFDCYYEGDVEKAVKEAMYRGGKSYDVFKNVRVTNCVLWNDWGKCLEIGAETRAEEIYDVVFEGCHIIHVTGAPLDCMNVDYAYVHDITYRNISVEYDDEIFAPMVQKNDSHKYTNSNPDFAPSIICAEVVFHPEYSAGGQRRGRNSGLSFEDIRYYGRYTPVFYFAGHSEDAKTADVTVKGFYLNGKKLCEGEYTLLKNEYCENIVIE